VDRPRGGREGPTFVATGAQLLARGKSTRRPPVLATLPDGSYLTQIYQLKLRVIEAKVTVTGADDTMVSDHYRLVTTLTDPRTDPAEALISLYHERWEIESAYFALRHTLLRGRVLRSKDPVGIEQEMWALLVLYQAIRTEMVTAVETRQGTAHNGKITSAGNLFDPHVPQSVEIRLLKLEPNSTPRRLTTTMRELVS